MTILRWIARVLSTLVILFFFATLLGDRPVTALTLFDWVKLSLRLTIMIGFLISWRWEVTGGFVVIAAFVVMVVLNPKILSMWAMWVSPLTAGLFILCGMRSKKKLEPAQKPA